METHDADVMGWLGILAPELQTGDGPRRHPLDRHSVAEDKSPQAWAFRSANEGDPANATPHYSEAQVQRITKALGAAAPAPALFSLRLAGVQEFIDQGRTTQDFWAGSYLISHLVSKELESYRLESLIFPYVGGSSKGRSSLDAGNVPNTVLALVSAQEAMRRLSETRIETEWDKISERVLNWCFHDGAKARHEWRGQTKGALEVFRAWTPWDLEEDYGKWYRRLSGIVESRKAFRDFEHAPQDGLKCSLCGWRSALVGRVKYRGKNLPLQPKERSRVRTRSNEALCAVCFTRRAASWYLEESGDVEARRQFPSTSSIAVRPFIEQIANKRVELKAELEAFEGSLAKQIAPLDGVALPNTPYPEALSEPQDALSKLLHYDGDWFYDTTYDPKTLFDEYGETVEAEATRAALGALVKAAKRFGIRRPFPYLAVLICDGDHAGKWISGELNGNPTLLGHCAFSEAISNLTALAAAAIKEANGELVYGGGDDLLAFLPLEDLPAAMGTLAATASSTHSNEGHLLPGTKFTVSIAAIAAPHNEPLAGVIQEATRLIKHEAKGTFGREAGVIAVRRQSGQQTVAGAKWESGAFEALSNLARRIAEKDLSPRFISQFGLLVSPMPHVSPFEKASEKVKKASQQEILHFVEALAEVENDPDLEKLAGEHANQFLDLLLTARFLSRAVAKVKGEEQR